MKNMPLLNIFTGYPPSIQGNLTYELQPYCTDLSENRHELTQNITNVITVTPKSPAYVFGEQVLRPAIDIAFEVGSYAINLFKSGFSSLDSTLSGVFNFIPGVKAEGVTEKSKESLVKSVLEGKSEKPNFNYHNHGPFQPLDIVKEGQLLTLVTHHGLYVIPLKKSLWDGVLMTNEGLGEDKFENRARFIDIQPDGDLKLGDKRTISSYRRTDPIKSYTIGTEIESNLYAEIFRRPGEQSKLNIVDSENTVIKTCPLYMNVYISDPERFNNNAVISTVNEPSGIYKRFTDLDSCQPRSQAMFEQFYHFPEGNKVALFARGPFGRFSVQIADSAGMPIGSPFFIRPSFIVRGNHTYINNYYMLENNNMGNNVTLVAVDYFNQSSQILGFCSQVLDKNNNFKPVESSSPYCQEMTNIRNVKKFTLQSASRQKWRGYLALFEYQEGLRWLALPVSTSLTFKIAPKSLFFSTPPVVIKIAEWVEDENSPQKAFIVSSRKTADLFSLIWPNDGLKYRTYRLNPIFVLGNRTSEGAEFSAQIGLLNTISIFHTSSDLGMRYNFTFLKRNGPDDLDSKYTFDRQRGEINIFGKHPATVFFNASACNEENFCASAEIKVNIIGKREEPTEFLPFILIGAGVLCCTLSICCISMVGGVLCKKYVILKLPQSHDYDDIELMPLLGNEEQEKYDLLEEDNRFSKLESLLKEGENLLELEKLNEAKQCFLKALTLDRENINAQSLLLGVVQKEKKQGLNQEGFKEGLVGDSFLQNYKIKLKSIEFLKNTNGDKKILGGGAFGTVYKGKYYNKKKTLSVAVKKIRMLFGSNPKGDEDIKKEAEIMLRMNGHPNLVNLYGVVEEEGKYMLVMELMSKGSLEDVLKNNKLSWKQKYSFIVDVARGLNYLHENDIVHRDLKPENVLLNDRWVAKITDFGKSRKDLDLRTTQIAGTPMFMDPWLLFLEYEQYDASCDMYSFGMFVWTLMNPEYTTPWSHIDNLNDLKKILMEEKKQEKIPDDCPEILKKIILACWDKNHDQRPTSRKILKLLVKNKDEICNYIHND